MKRKTRYLDAAGARSIRGHAQIRFRNSQKRPVPVLGKILYALIFLIFAGVIAYVLFFSQLLAITQINVKGTQKIDPSDVRKMIETQLAGSFLRFIPKNNILLAGGSSIKRSILEKYKYAGKVQVKKDFPGGLDIAIEEREFNLVLCSNGECYVVDDSGTAFAKADFEKNELGENSLPVLYDDSSKSVEIGQTPVDQDYINYLLRIREKLSGDLKINSDREMHTPQLASGDIRVKTEEGWLIYFDKSISADKEIEMLKLVLENKIDPNKRSDLEYIDLRTDNKVYYKFKTGEQNSSDQSQSNKT